MVTPQKECQGRDVLVWIVAFAKTLLSLRVAKAHGSPDLSAHIFAIDQKRQAYILVAGDADEVECFGSLVVLFGGKGRGRNTGEREVGERFGSKT